MSAGMHEKIVGIFVGGPPCQGLRATTEQATLAEAK